MMSSVTKLKAALAAVPVGRPCTAAAVGALHEAGTAAAQQLTDADTDRQKLLDHMKTCLKQRLPLACLPVLTWLAAGLSSGLPPAATQQAYETACALLGVMGLVLSHDMRVTLISQQLTPQQKRNAADVLQHLGPPGEVFHISLRQHQEVRASHKQLHVLNYRCCQGQYHTMPSDEHHMLLICGAPANNTCGYACILPAVQRRCASSWHR